VLAAVPAPSPPDVYEVRIRYRIQAFRTERVAQFFEMLRYLEAHGFRRDTNEDYWEDEAENPQRVTLRGSIPSNQVQAILAERHVKALLLLPQGAKLPEDKAELIRVDLRLADGFPLNAQRLLHEQAREVLASIQLREAVGYDHRGFTRILGSIPVGRLETLLTDLRKVPAGTRQPAPFASVWPLRVAEAQPGMELPKPRPRPAAIPAGQEKLSADLRELIANAASARASRRLEVVLASAPAEDEVAWRNRLASGLPGLAIEGRLGPVVTVVLPPAQAPALAASDLVVGVRLPRIARPDSAAGSLDVKNWKPLLDASGVATLHDRNFRGKGSRAVLIDSDFNGWQAMVGKQLPARTRLVDLTVERNADLQPDPFSPGGSPGPGTRRAVAFSQAAPEAELTLVRVDPAAPYMIYQIARAINGDPYLSISLDNRLKELQADGRRLDQRREQLLEERKTVFESFEQEGESAKRRDDYRKKQAEFDRDQVEHNKRIDRFLQHQRAVKALVGVRLVASALVWDEGYPADGSSSLSRYFDDRPFHAALWFQAAGDARGQSWAGMFRDADGNGVMEFVPPETPLPEGVWTPELNFLAWRAAGKDASLDLPANARVRISLQWREAHEALYQNVGEDRYREPLARLRLVVLQQPDPKGTRQPADDLVVIRQSSGAPQRLSHTPSGAVYEQTVEFEVPKAGRYALRVEGRPPDGILPANTPTIPAAHKEGELQVRLFVTTLAGPGRAVWRNHATPVGSLGMPGDARSAVTTGAADAAGRAQPYSAGGPPFALDLLPKPDVLTFDSGGGTGQAAAFAAGVAAAVQSAGGSRAGFFLDCATTPGTLLRVTPKLHPEGAPARFP
jgi:hypothetical protein